MPAQVVVVLQEAAVAEELAEAIRTSGRTVRSFTDPLEALEALEQAEKAELLITCIGFPPGKPNGKSLALMGRMRRPGIKLIFLTRPGEDQHVCDLGECLPLPADVPKLTAMTTTLLSGTQPPARCR